MLYDESMEMLNTRKGQLCVFDIKTCECFLADMQNESMILDMNFDLSVSKAFQFVII